MKPLPLLILGVLLGALGTYFWLRDPRPVIHPDSPVHQEPVTHPDHRPSPIPGDVPLPEDADEESSEPTPVESDESEEKKKEEAESQEEKPKPPEGIIQESASQNNFEVDSSSDPSQKTAPSGDVETTGIIRNNGNPNSTDAPQSNNSSQEACENGQQTVLLHAQDLERSEQRDRAPRLPFLSARRLRGSTSSTPPVHKVGFTDHTHSDEGLNYVVDGQVWFKFDLNDIPPRSTADEITLRLRGLQFINDSGPQSHLLCLVDPQICSGRIDSSHPFKNTSFFFGGHSDPANAVFSNLFSTRRDGTAVDVPRRGTVTSIDREIDLASVLRNNHHGWDPASLIYEHASTSEANGHPTLYWVIADAFALSPQTQLVVKTTAACGE